MAYVPPSRRAAGNASAPRRSLQELLTSPRHNRTTSLGVLSADVQRLPEWVHRKMEQFNRPDYAFSWGDDDDAYVRNRNKLKRELREPNRCQTSPKNYIARELREREVVGFHAASVVLWRPAMQGGDVQLLMAFERRKDKFGFNFIGGHRDCLKERPWAVMAREVEEETAGYLKLCADTPTDAMMWDIASKQAVSVRALSPHECQTRDGDIVDAIQNLNHPPEEIEGARFSPPECVLTVAWVDLADFCNHRWRTRNIHPQTFTMAMTLLSDESQELLAESAPLLAEALMRHRG